MARVDAATEGPGWVVDGNYSVVRDVVWAKADAVVWFDLPYVTVLARVVRRTVRRSLTREELWNGNREPFSNLWSLDPKKSIIAWTALDTACTARATRRPSANRAGPGSASCACARRRRPTGSWPVWRPRQTRRGEMDLELAGKVVLDHGWHGRAGPGAGRPAGRRGRVGGRVRPGRGAPGDGAPGAGRGRRRAGGAGRRLASGRARSLRGRRRGPLGSDRRRGAQRRPRLGRARWRPSTTPPGRATSSSS